MVSTAFRLGVVHGLTHAAAVMRTPPAKGWKNDFLDSAGYDLACEMLGINNKENQRGWVPEALRIWQEYERGCDAGARIGSRGIEVSEPTPPPPNPTIANKCGNPNCPCATPPARNHPVEEIAVFVTREEANTFNFGHFHQRVTGGLLKEFPGTKVNIYIGDESVINFQTSNGYLLDRLKQGLPTMMKESNEIYKKIRGVVDGIMKELQAKNAKIQEQISRHENNS